MSESERLEIARSLHDGIAQDLIGVAYRLENILNHEEITPAIKAEVRAMQSQIGSTISAIRDEIFALREGDSLSLEARIESFIATIVDGPTITFSASPVAVDTRRDELLSRVAEELIRNAVAHAGASRIDIALSESEDWLHLSIIDNGNGGLHARTGHFGLAISTETVESLGGTFECNTANGTSIWIRVPRTSCS
jgi:signal transduction histidine kinase